MITSVNCSRSNPSLPMIARFESGEVSLTTSIREIGVQFCLRVMTRDAPAANLLTEAKLRHSRQFRRAPQTQQITRIQRACDFQQQVRPALLLSHGHRRQHIIRNVKSHAHGVGYATSAPASTTCGFRCCTVSSPSSALALHPGSLTPRSY